MWQFLTNSLKVLMIIVAFSAAFLLFLLQPLVTKYYLPVYGGSSQTWLVSSLFFQICLLLGYGLASWQMQAGWRRVACTQAVIILVVVAAYQAIDPVFGLHFTHPWIENLAINWQVGSLLLALWFSVAAVFIILSTTAPLTQYWWRTSTQSAPFWLYAVSNIGSLLGLLAYPLWFERRFSVAEQAVWWFYGWLAVMGLVLLMVCVSWVVRSLDLHEHQQEKQEKKVIKSKLSGYGLEKLEGMQVLKIVAWSGFPVFVSLAVTNHLTQSMAAVPLLWILPLSLYLLSFVFAFQDAWELPPHITTISLTTVLVLLIGLLGLRGAEFRGALYLDINLIGYSIVLLGLLILFHRKLYQLRPNKPELLGTYYVWMSVGGAVGGLLVSIVAPLIFRGYWEVELSLSISLVITFITLRKYLNQHHWSTRFLSAKEALVGVIGYVVIATALIITQPLWKSIYVSRNFYGVLAVVQQENETQLFNGAIIHGLEIEGQTKPSSYYHANTAVSQVIQLVHAHHSAPRIGVIGLGAGELALLCQPKDTWVFYEINPSVVDVARKYFSHLQHCPQVEIVLGDARIEIERETEKQQLRQYHALIVDAFSDDAIPVHLITEQAIASYQQQLATDGVLLFHISNRNLDLAPVFAAVSRDTQLDLSIIDTYRTTEKYQYPAVWVVISQRDNQLHKQLLKNLDSEYSRALQLQDIQLIEPWTDERNNVFDVIRW